LLDSSTKRPLNYFPGKRFWVGGPDANTSELVSAAAIDQMTTTTEALHLIPLPVLVQQAQA
jgi:hypothetical protein